jgi:hypothetical protein
MTKEQEWLIEYMVNIIALVELTDRQKEDIYRVAEFCIRMAYTSGRLDEIEEQRTRR